MFERTSERAKRVLVSAREQAGRLGSQTIGTEHLLLAILAEGDGAAWDVLGAAGVTADRVRSELSEIAGTRSQSPGGHIPFTPRALRIIEMSLKQSEQFGSASIQPEHMLLALLIERQGLGTRLIVRLGGDPDRVRAQVVDRIHRRSRARQLKYEDLGTPLEEMAQNLQGGAAGRAEGAGYAESGERGVRPDQGATGHTAFRGVLVRDLTQAARDGRLDPVVGFDVHYDRILRTLGRRSRANVLLVGEPGVGKTALVDGLAQRSVTTPIFRIALHAALGESFPPGDSWLDDGLAECGKRGVIPFFDDVHRIAESGRWQSSAADLLYAMSEHEVPVIAAVTAGYFDECLAADSHLRRRFRIVRLDEPTPEQALEILKAVRGVYEEHHRVRYTDTALEAAIRADGASDVALPARAIDVIDEAGAHERVRRFAAVAELDGGLLKRLSELRREKETAIEGQDFETAARLRGEEKELYRARDEASQMRQQLTRIDETVIVKIIAGHRVEQPSTDPPADAHERSEAEE
jgi:ATP-dependent Clp protease ATP-binding subunit ClpC